MKKKLVIGLILTVLLLFLIILLVDINGNNKNKVEEKLGLVEKQEIIEKNINIENYTIDNPNIIVNPYEISPLTALIAFNTEKKVSPKITIKGKDEYSTYTYTFASDTKHYLPIYGLYPDYNNEIIIEYENVKKVINIKTDKLPDDFILPTKVTANKEKLSNQLYFFTPSSTGYTCAYDVNGDVRWYFTESMIWNIERLANGNLLLSTERLINPPYYTTGLYEIDLLGKIYNEYNLEGGYHHDYFELENGNLLIATDDFNNDSGTVEDYIIELDRNTGKIVKQIDLKDILNMEDGQSESWTAYDWFHNNSVWYDKKTNSITLSGRHKDAVINIDYDNLKLNWIIGDSTNWDSEYQKYFFTPVGNNFEWQWSQHAAMITPEGYVFILDNGNNKSKIKEKYVSAENSYTRGVMYKIDTKKMEIEQIWQYGKERGSDYYSPYISDVDYLDKNHYIVHSGGISYKDGKILNVPAGLGQADKLNSITTELLNDEIIFEIELPTNNYRVEKMDLYKTNNYKLGKANIIGSLGQTKVDKKSYGLLLNSHEVDKEYKSHNIKFTKEKDRLVFSGQFKKGTSVNVLLHKNLITNQYNVPISKKPYTAMCVDIFTEEETENGIIINKYINSNNLNGKYNIYLEINGKIYNTKEYVEF